MGRYDKEREEMGLKPISNSSAPKENSRYVKEREAIMKGVSVDSVDQPYRPIEEIEKVIAEPVQTKGRETILRGAKDTDIPLTEKQQKEVAKELNKELRAGFNQPKVNQVMNRVSEGLMQAGNAVGLGIPDAVTGHTLANRPDYEQTAAGTTGKVVGELAGFAKAYKLTKGLADLAIKKGAGRAVERELATHGIHSSRMANEFIRGGIAEGAFGAAKELADVAFDTRQNDNEGIVERAKNVATATAYGAVGDAGLTGLLGVGRQLIGAKKVEPSAIPNDIKPVENPSQSRVEPVTDKSAELKPSRYAEERKAIQTETIAEPVKVVDGTAQPKAESVLPKSNYSQEVQSQLDELESIYQGQVETVRRGGLRSEDKSKQLKGMAMQHSADKRNIIQGDRLIKVDGGWTDKELSNEIKRLRTNYSGKEVIVDGAEGIVTKTAFGKVGVQFADGQVKFVDPSSVNPKLDIDKLIKQQSKEAESAKAKPNQPSKYAKERESMQESALPPARSEKGETIPEPNELKFSQTVKQSENTPDELTTAMKENPMVGARTTDVLNRKQADELIAKHGKEGLYTELVSKKFNLSPAESTAAQKLAKEFASKGGEENISKAIALISKTAREGREMGQAIQALTQWNKLDETGALLMGQRQLNRGVKDTAEWKELTPAQAKPLQESAERIGQANETKSLADEVLSIVTNKQAGEALTDVEKATIQRFQDQVKDIDSKVKGFLPKSKNKAHETIKEIKDVAPKDRTRDQVVNYLDAKAELARKRIEKSRNIGILPDLNNPVTDYAIIGASHIARGIRNYADYAETMIKDFGNSVKPHLKEAYTKSVRMFRKENGLPSVEELDRIVNQAVKSNQLDKETADSLKAIASEIGFYTDKNLKIEATQDLQRALKGLGTSSLGEKLSTLQTGAQLLNFVTIGRNVLGNTGQMAMEKINKMWAVPVDWGISKLTGERTIQFFPHNQEKYWSNFATHGKAGWNGVSPTGTLNSYDVRPEVFGDKNPLKYTTKSLGATLQSFDGAAYRQAYGDVVATYGEQLGKAQGLTKVQIKERMPKLIEQLDERIHEMADQAGLYATFQDETLLSKAAEFTKKALNKMTDYPIEKYLVDTGILPKKFSTQGFGLGDIVLKYARTPANLVMRGIDYSPLGLLRATGELLPLVFNKSRFNQFEATRALSRAITGTLGLTGMGYVLADVGILTGTYNKDKDVRSIEEQSGQGSYKVNWSALSRFIGSGFDKKEAKFQKGDRMMSYEWLQPAAISIAMGVNANKALDEATADTSGWQIIQQALLGGFSTVLENPMVQGLSNVIDAGTEIIKNQDTTQAKRIAKNVPTSFVPTLVGQARTATDNQQRETRDEKILTEMFNLIKNKIPGASKTLPIAFDSLGNERERIQGSKSNSLGQYLTAFFSPAKFTKYEVSEEAKMVLNILDESGNKNILPRIVDRGLEVDDPITGESERVILTGKQFSDLQKNVGQQTKSMLKEYEYFLADPNVTIEEKTAAMSKILTHVGQVARNEMRESMGVRQKRMR